MKVNYSLFLVVLLFLFPSLLTAQVKSKPLIVPLSGTVNPSEVTDDWNPVLMYMAPPPGSQDTKTEHEQRKQKVRDQFPIRNYTTALENKTAVQPDPPSIIRNFQGNYFNNAVPNDNSIAVSTDRIVSVVNTNFRCYNLSGTLLLSKSLSIFGNSIGNINYPFDPRVAYDPTYDRFIVVFLNGFTDTTNSIIVAFSQTNLPEGAWNLYQINGNPLTNGTWSDYPAIAISNDELFITLNTFTNGSSNNSGYTESTIWQIDKQKGYAADTLDMLYHYNITWNGDTLFNTTPATYANSNDSTGMFFIGSEPFDSLNDTLYVIRIPGNMATTPVASVTPVTAPVQYGFPPSARQLNNVKELDTNDGRIQGAYVKDDNLHLVLNSINPTTGLCGVYYARIDSLYQNPTINVAAILGDTLKDFAYPNIVYGGPINNNSLIMMLYSSPNDSTGYGCAKVDFSGNFSSFVPVKKGFSYLALLSSTTERWGDYSGMAQKFDEPGKAWVSGCYSDYANRNQTWIAELSDSLILTSTLHSQITENPTLTIWPNPAYETVSVNISIENQAMVEIALLNASGQVIRTILRERFKAGNTIFSFNTNHLVDGVYILRCETENEILTYKKIVVQH